MKLENRCLVPADIQRTWELLMDIPRAAACVPGMEEVVQEEDGSYRASMRVRVGPMGLTLAGTLRVLEQDSAKGEARFLIEASDRKVGGAVRADLLIQLRSEENNQTELVLNTDTTFIGRLGELGQPLIRRKANNTMQDFARNLAQQLSQP
ncbi:MAG: SRPBCC family protein [bacterium]|nr:SRPBCC family protein [bacterium]